MKAWTGVVCSAFMMVWSAGCNATTRYQVLSFLFDGVPPPQAAPAVDQQQTAAAGTAPARQVGYRAHGPYAAKLCNACHNSGATNALLLPREELCFQCHELKLNKKYIHGPLASGGCLACHDPHSSQYRYFLVSESDDFCFRCHDAEMVARNTAHAGMQQQCTTCHDAHMSDKRYLLR